MREGNPPPQPVSGHFLHTCSFMHDVIVTCITSSVPAEEDFTTQMEKSQNGYPFDGNEAIPVSDTNALQPNAVNPTTTVTHTPTVDDVAPEKPEIFFSVSLIPAEDHPSESHAPELTDNDIAPEKPPFDESAFANVVDLHDDEKTPLTPTGEIPQSDSIAMATQTPDDINLEAAPQALYGQQSALDGSLLDNIPQADSGITNTPPQDQSAASPPTPPNNQSNPEEAFEFPPQDMTESQDSTAAAAE